jgi:hypothetical protein
VEIGPTTSFSTAGAVSLAAGQTVIAAGALTLGDKSDKVVNGGLVETLGGTIVAAGKVSGKGSFAIDGGLLDCASSFGQNVAFTGVAGTLELAKSQSYGGTIGGFSKTGGTFLDLSDIAFTGSGEATFSGTTKSGVLTVTDGTHTAHIKLSGNYTTSTFVASSDGHGGTIVIDPRAPAPLAASIDPAPAHRFIAAMAGLAGPSASPVSGSRDGGRACLPMLARPATRAV